MSKTTTLYDILQSELIRSGKNEFMNGDQIVLFDDRFSFMKKIMHYDSDVELIVNEKFFIGQSLNNIEHDKKFKQAFIHRFLDRRINQQTLEIFANRVAYTFLTNEDYINRIYNDLDLYLSSKQTNTQRTVGTNVTDNRSAYSELPQDNVHLDVDSTVMTTAKDNTISRNKQRNDQENSTENNQYRLDDLLKINGLLDRVFDVFDKTCFMQTW